jgi:large subunit ribosomal protein L28
VSQQCDVCDKHPVFGKTVARLGRNATHRKVKGRSPRQFKPNLQTVRTKGVTRRRVCTSCLKAGKATP